MSQGPSNSHMCIEFVEFVEFGELVEFIDLFEQHDKFEQFDQLDRENRENKQNAKREKHGKPGKPIKRGTKRYVHNGLGTYGSPNATYTMVCAHIALAHQTVQCYGLIACGVPSVTYIMFW